MSNMQQGLNLIYPHKKDYSFIPSFGATAFDTSGLPANFSVYGGQLIPDQDSPDTRFVPPIPPLPMGCTGEATTFIGNIEDTNLYNPQSTYLQTPPGTLNTGRDVRDALQSTIDIGYQDAHGVVGYKRLAYFNVYGTNTISDYDAAKIAIWLNQNEKRAVSVGSWFYPEWVEKTSQDGILCTPSFNTQNATLHNWIITGWKTINGVEYLEMIPWIGMQWGNNGIGYVSREIFNALMAQPYTAMFTLTKETSNAPIPVGWQAITDHFVYYFRNLLGV